MRVLHLIDGGFRGGGPGAEAEAAVMMCKSLTERAVCQHSVCVLGPRSSVIAVERHGLAVDGAIAPGLGLPEMGWRLLRRMLSSWGRPAVIQAWGARAARLALRAVGDSILRVAVLPDGVPAPADVAVTFSPDAQVMLAESGAEIGRTLAIPAPAWEPDVRSRAEVRRELGVREGEVLVLQLGAAPRADAIRFMFLMGLLREATAPVRGVMRTCVGGRLRAAGFDRGVGRGLVGISERPLCQLLGACDLAVFDGGGPGPTRDWAPAPAAAAHWIAPALGAGVPVVAAGWALRELGGIPGCAAYNSTLPEITRKLAALAEDPELRRHASARGRELLGAGPPGEEFARTMMGIWEESLAREARDG